MSNQSQRSEFDEVEGSPGGTTDEAARYELGTRLVAELGSDAVLSISGGGPWASACLDVPVHRWREAVTLARTRHGLEFFDWLGGATAKPGMADPPEEERLHVVVHLWSLPARCGVLLRTTVPAVVASVPSIVDIFAGAGWYERETFEMFGIDFVGHPALRKLLLTDEFSGNPLRKDFVLASRVVKAWPGEKEPGDAASDAAATTTGRPRRRMLPPGVPEPGTWPAVRESDVDR